MAESVILKRRKAQKLQNICLSVVVKNFDVILAEPSHKQYLTMKWSQKLLKICKETDGKYVSMEHALVLINPWLKELNLNQFHPSDLPVILNKLATIEKASTVTSMCASGRKKISLDMLWQITYLLPSTLLDLCLSRTNCNDKMLKVIAEKCPQLRKLDLSLCRKFGTSGLKAFCSKNGEVYKNDVLQSLDLYDTSVGREGIIFVLASFPNLLLLKYEDLSEVIYEMHYGDYINNRLSETITYNLRILRADRVCDSYCDVLQMFSVLCPCITELELCIEDQREIDAAASFTSLEKVNFYMSEFSKSCTLVPFLKKKGNSLTSLLIGTSASFSVSAETLVEFCSNLTQLVLYSISFKKMKSLANNDLKHSLPHLTSLIIVGGYQKNMADSLFYILSRSSSLKTCKFLGDEPFHAASFIDVLVHSNCFSTLKQLELRNIKVTLLDELIEAASGFNVNYKFPSHFSR